MNTLEDYENNYQLFVDDVNSKQANPDVVASFIRFTPYQDLHRIFNYNKGLTSSIVDMNSDNALQALVDGFVRIHDQYKNLNYDYFNHNDDNILRNAIIDRNKLAAQAYAAEADYLPTPTRKMIINSPGYVGKPYSHDSGEQHASIPKLK